RNCRGLAIMASLAKAGRPIYDNGIAHSLAEGTIQNSLVKLHKRADQSSASRTKKSPAAKLAI
ncbi:MAG: hypothetical protein ACO38X_09940, partial [bacterium]